jgi:hypothetical protein
MKYLENLAERITEANLLTVKPVCSLRRAQETYNVLKNGQSTIGEEATADICLAAIEEALEALVKQQDILCQLQAEAKVKELLK